MIIRACMIMCITLLGFQAVVACDACGSSTTASGVGVYTAFKSTFVRLGWHTARFTGSPEHGDGSDDRFQTYNLSVRYYISDRFKVLFHQPYRLNTRNVNGQKQQLNGFGDPRVIGSYTFLNDVELGSQSKLFFEVGGGFQLPVGKYDDSIHDKDLPENFNVGSGAWGFIVQPNAVLKIGSFGLVFSGDYQYNTISVRSGYRFGQQLSGQSSVFWEGRISNSVKVIPSIGIHTETVGSDTFSNGERVDDTGGTGWFSTVSLNLSVGESIVGASWSNVINAEYSNGEVIAKDRFTIHISYIF